MCFLHVIYVYDDGKLRSFIVLLTHRHNNINVFLKLYISATYYQHILNNVMFLHRYQPLNFTVF